MYLYNIYVLKTIKSFIIIGFLLVYGFSMGQQAPTNFKNPVLSGFNPDPSICRVGDDYYMVTSSFTWFPGIPIYHSKDLVNWELIGHGITRKEQLDFEGVKDEKGVWAVTIRYHQGLFYLITTCNNCGGNFYITTKDPAGEWSNPVWLNEASGIDPSLFWDEDGTCYYTGNTWDFKHEWQGQCAIWIQELDLEKQKLIGEKKILTYGYANNAAYAEGPHIYKIDDEYLLLMSEGGSSSNHAITSHHSSTLFGNYIADKVNPVLSHRQFGNNYPLQTIGHGDLVQTQNGEWWAVVLGTRDIKNNVRLTRETFLCKVNIEEGTPIFNPGYGKVLIEQKRPLLPWTPVEPENAKDEFDKVSKKWYTINTPKNEFYKTSNGKLYLNVLPSVADSLNHSSILIQRIKDFKYSATTKLSFNPKKNEQAGLIIYRTNNSYYMLVKEKKRVVLIKKFKKEKKEIASLPYSKDVVFFKVDVNQLDIQFSAGASLNKMIKVGAVQNITVIAEGNGNRFNGPGIGMYTTANGQKSNNKAVFDWFEYK
ncbi:glycoside hydrolase family 43 protein [Wenyingzhuangia sp. IMCC45467]